MASEIIFGVRFPSDHPIFNEPLEKRNYIILKALKMYYDFEGFLYQEAVENNYFIKKE